MIQQITDNISLIDAAPPITGFEGFIGVYVIRAQKVALIDVGPTSSVENLFSALSELRIDPADVAYILCTHIHLDHTGGLGSAIKNLPNAQVVVHEKGRRHLAEPGKLWEGSLQVLGKMAQDYGQPEPVPDDRLITAQENMVIDLGDIRIETLLTPGHAPHHLSFIDRDRGYLFPGEAAGIYLADQDISRPATPPPFDLKEAFNSIDKLLKTNPREIYFSHFGHANEAVKYLQKYKKELIGWSKIIARETSNTDISKITEAVLDWDKTKEIIYRLPPDRLQTELFFIHNNIRGLLDYFKHEGTGILANLQE